MKEMTVAEAIAAGVFGGKSKGRVKKRTTQEHEPRAGALSRCTSHDESFTTDAAENRHVAAHHGCRVETVL